MRHLIAFLSKWPLHVLIQIELRGCGLRFDLGFSHRATQVKNGREAGSWNPAGDSYSVAHVTKRYLLQVAARNLSLIMRKLFGVGTPRGLQAERDSSSLTDLIRILFATLWTTFWRTSNAWRSSAHLALESLRPAPRFTPAAGNSRFSTAC